MKRRVATTGLAAIAVAIASLFACRQIVDFREEPAALAPADAGVDAGAAACGLEYGTSRCASCVSAHCCSASSACAADPACAPYASCVGACAGDPTCRAQCSLAAPPGSSDEGPALTACVVAQCDTECGLTCGGVVSALTYGGVPPDAAAACQSCVVANGCDVARACGASADCDDVRFCTGVCPTFDCIQACQIGHDGGVSLALAAASIIAGDCAGACARGADWTCVGHRSWPRPKSNTVTMTIQVKDYISGATLSGIDVSICDGKDPECASPKAYGTTDDAGNVVLQFANPQNPMNYLGLDGYVQLQSPDDAGTKIVPWLYYWGFPLSEREYALVDSASFAWTILVQTPDDATQLTALIGVPDDPSASYLIAGASDCDDHLAPEVKITTAPQYPTVQEVYGLTPSETATDAMYGFATFAEVPPGSIEVIATPVALDQPSSRQTVNIRKGWVTWVNLIPTP